MDGHPQKYLVDELAMCAECGFLADHPAMLEWHLFFSHLDLARSLLLYRWPRLGRRLQHEDCARCRVHTLTGIKNEYECSSADPPHLLEPESGPRSPSSLREA